VDDGVPIEFGQPLYLLQETDERDELAIRFHGVEPGEPILSGMGADLIFLHVGIDLKFVADLLGVDHEISVNTIFCQDF
jgi:hypothetical protein